MGQMIYAKAQHIVAQSKIDAARITQKSGNEKRAAASELERFSQSLGNQRALDAAGARQNAIAENVGRAIDSATMGKFSDRIRAAEELGAHVSDAASAGVGGSSVDAYNETLRLSYAMQEEQARRGVDSDVIAADRQRGEVLQSAVASLGNDIYSPDLDFTQYVDDKKPSTFKTVLGIAATAAATVYGGPQAGKAVMGMFDASNAAANGQFDKAASSFNGAFISGLQAFDTLHKAGGHPWGAKPKAAPNPLHIP